MYMYNLLTHYTGVVWAGSTALVIDESVNNFKWLVDFLGEPSVLYNLLMTDRWVWSDSTAFIVSLPSHLTIRF